MNFGKTISNILLVSCFTSVSSFPLARAQSSYTPIQFGHVHKPYGSENDGPGYSAPATSPTGAPSASGATPPSGPPPVNAQSALQAPPQQTAVQEPPEQTAVQQSPQQSPAQQPTEQRQVGNFLRGVGNALRSTGGVNNRAYVNGNNFYNGAYSNSGVYPNNGASIGAFARNFSGKPSLVNGVPYLGGSLPSAKSVAHKVSISSLKEDFPLPAGKDDLDTFDNKQLAQRANGAYIQRHYFVGTEGAGIIGRHGPQWHVGSPN